MADCGGDPGDVEVLYDVPYANGNEKGYVGKGYVHGGGGGQYISARNKDRGTGKHKNPTARATTSHVDFENVFDPFERDQDDVREFFDDASEEKNDNGNDDWEKPTMFNDPRKVRRETLFEWNGRQCVANRIPFLKPSINNAYHREN